MLHPVLRIKWSSGLPRPYCMVLWTPVSVSVEDDRFNLQRQWCQSTSSCGCSVQLWQRCTGSLLATGINPFVKEYTADSSSIDGNWRCCRFFSLLGQIGGDFYCFARWCFELSVQSSCIYSSLWIWHQHISRDRAQKVFNKSWRAWEFAHSCHPSDNSANKCMLNILSRNMKRSILHEVWQIGHVSYWDGAMLPNYKLAKWQVQEMCSPELISHMYAICVRRRVTITTRVD